MFVGEDNIHVSNRDEFIRFVVSSNCIRFDSSSSCTSSTTGAPACLPGGNTSATLQIAAGSIVQQSINVTIDASGASVAPGTYSFTVTATDSATGLIHTTTFPVSVRPATAGSGALGLVSGATSSNSASLNFAVPQGVTLSNPSCAEVIGTGIASAESPGTVGMACTFGPPTPGSTTPTGAQLVTTKVTVTTNGATAAMTPLESGGQRPVLLVAGLLLPFFGLIGIRRGRKSVGAVFLRTLAIVALAIAGFQTMGCGGSYHSGTAGVTGGTTPPGVYYVLMSATGSDGNSYQAVLQVNVNL